eukprot:2099535-Prymnesium_polylepis.1
MRRLRPAPTLLECATCLAAVGWRAAQRGIARPASVFFGRATATPSARRRLVFGRISARTIARSSPP